MADSWREMAKLQEALKQLAEFISKTPLPRASISCAHRDNQHIENAKDRAAPRQARPKFRS
jgi:hypothetical protein